MSHAMQVFGILLLALLAGCADELGESPADALPGEQAAQSPADVERDPPLRAGPKQLYSPSGVSTDWSDSADGTLSMQIGTDITPGAGPIRLWAGLRNNTTEAMRVVKPFGDAYYVGSTGLKIVGPRGRCQYVGKIPDYTLGENCYTTIDPGQYMYDQYEIDPKLFSDFGEAGAYDILYRYHGQLPSEVVSGPVRTLLGRDRTYRGDGSIEKLLTFEFGKPRYRFSHGEAARGVTFKYELVVRDRTPPVIVFRTSAHSGDNLGDGNIPVFEALSGIGNGYAINDVGLGPDPQGRPVEPLAKARHKYAMHWDGRNWSGPSDTGMLKGPPFPPGEHTLTVSTWGVVEESDGARYFRIEGKVPVEIVPCRRTSFVWPSFSVGRLATTKIAKFEGGVA